jgi:hypothetical protein
MKSWLWKGMLAAAIALPAVEFGYAREREHAATCTLATLKGRYLFVINGTVFPPASGVTTQSLFTRSGYRIFNGDGTGTSIATTSINGKVQDPDIHSDLSYTVNADCTGILKVLAVGATQELFIAPDGEDMTVIATDKGHVEAFRSWRVGPE